MKDELKLDRCGLCLLQILFQLIFTITCSSPSRSVEGAPAVQHLLMWHRGARPGLLLQQSLHRGAKTS